MAIILCCTLHYKSITCDTCHINTERTMDANGRLSCPDPVGPACFGFVLTINELVNRLVVQRFIVLCSC